MPPRPERTRQTSPKLSRIFIATFGDSIAAMIFMRPWHREHSGTSIANVRANSSAHRYFLRWCSFHDSGIGSLETPTPGTVALPDGNGSSVLFQREGIQRRPALDAHILLSLDHVTHGAGGNR